MNDAGLGTKWNGIFAVIAVAVAIIAVLVWWDPFNWSPNDDTIPVAALEDDLDNSDGNGTINVVPNGGMTISDPCRLDKVGTWSEGNNAYRIEVGGHGGQHLDFYPQVGVKSVSYIVDKIANPEGVPNIAWGFGSLWEGDTPECTSYDWIKDETVYANARLDSGHSGLVIDLRNTPPEVVANEADMNQDAIDSLLAQHYAAMEQNGQQFQPSGTSVISSAYSIPVAQTEASSCPDGVRGPDFDSTPGTLWSPGDINTWRSVNFWTNWPDMDQGEQKIILAPGDPGNLQGGGSFWSWPSHCETEARSG